MKNFYRIILLLLVFIFISTFNPTQTNIALKKKYNIFKIQEIKIINNFLINKKEIEQRIQDIYEKNIFLISKKDINKSLKNIDFLNNISVKKKYPNTIIIKVFETKPLAVLFKNKKKYFIDNFANLILFRNDINLNNLPKIIGDNAEDTFLIFLKQLNSNDFPVEKIETFYYFQIDRWDVQLFDNKIIKFPNTEVKKAIVKAINLLNRKDFEFYKIIDLRFNGKVIVE
tara:strand:+ start:458 stop:1141 length:684 start_codon:yes stop_codon:yes gene_type:complete